MFVLTLCLLGNFPCFLRSVYFLSKSTYSKKSFRMSNRLDPDQARHFVRPDLGPICLQKNYEQTTLVGNEL